MGLCLNRDEQFTRGHKCKHLVDITQNSSVRGWRTMFLKSIVLGHYVRILVDTGNMHNIIDINFARLVGLMERRIDITILIGSNNETACREAYFNMPLHIATETFQIGAFLVDLGVDIDIVLGMPWMADLGSILWNFASLTVTFTVPAGKHRKCARPTSPTTRRCHASAAATAVGATTTIIVAATLQPDQCHQTASAERHQHSLPTCHCLHPDPTGSQECPRVAHLCHHHHQRHGRPSLVHG
jgi:hypothetical protein